MSHSSFYRAFRFSAALLVMASACGEEDTTDGTTEDGDDDDGTDESKDAGKDSGKDSSSGGNDAGKDSGGGKDAAADSSSGGGDEVTLADIYTPILKTSGTCTSCHPVLAKDKPLDLSTVAKAYETLVENQEPACGDKPYVTPGDPDNSFFLDVIAKEDPGCDIARMPDGSDPLPEEEIAQVRKWIEDGAKP